MVRAPPIFVRRIDVPPHVLGIQDIPRNLLDSGELGRPVLCAYAWHALCILVMEC